MRPNQDYELVSGVGFYKMHTEAVSWDEVRKACIDEGSHLVILNSLTEVEVVKSIWSKHPIISGSQWPEYIYIGAHDLLEEGKYVTVLGKEQRHKSTVECFLIDRPRV